jgi:hypothetical protein
MVVRVAAAAVRVIAVAVVVAADAAVVVGVRILGSVVCVVGAGVVEGAGPDRYVALANVTLTGCASAATALTAATAPALFW